MRGHYADNVKPRATTTKKAYFDMDNWLFFLGGMTICCAILIPMAKLADWLQDKLDEWNEYNDEQQQLNEQEQ